MSYRARLIDYTYPLMPLLNEFHRTQRERGAFVSEAKIFIRALLVRGYTNISEPRLYRKRAECKLAPRIVRRIRAEGT